VKAVDERDGSSQTIDARLEHRRWIVSASAKGHPECRRRHDGQNQSGHTGGAGTLGKQASNQAQNCQVKKNSRLTHAARIQPPKDILQEKSISDIHSFHGQRGDSFGLRLRTRKHRPKM
jgi:hypothetical protein